MTQNHRPPGHQQTTNPPATRPPTTHKPTARRTYTKRHRSGNTSTWIKIEPGESALIIRDDRYYRLGGQLDDVVGGHVLTEAKEVRWCSITQTWEPAGGQPSTTTAP